MKYIKYIKFLFSPVFMGVLLLLFAVAMAAATFIENDFGSPAAYSMVYNTRWFELILFLLAVNLFGQIVIFKLFRKTKLTVALFHLSFILMIIGAGITRYFGWEGTMHIREGEEQKECFSNEKYIGYSVKDNNGAIITSQFEKYSMTSISADNFKKVIKTDGRNYDLVLAKIIPNASETITDSPEGEPIISLLVTKEMTSRETLILKKGDLKTTNGISIGFASGEKADLNISVDSGSFFIRSRFDLGEMNMMTQAVTFPETGKPVKLKQMQIITFHDIKIVPQQMSLNGTIKAVAVKPEEQNTGENAFIFHLFSEKESATLCLWDKETEKIATGSCVIDGKTVEIIYGSKPTMLPFAIKLNRFVLERYPGSASPSGYKSDVILLDKNENIEKPFMIFMNNILKYKGYRFYQSSFDRDEKGTILSVNHDSQVCW